MPLIHPRGDPASRIWIVLDHAFPSDEAKGYLLSGGLGYVYEKMFTEAGLSLFDAYVCARRPDTDNPNSYSSVDSSLVHYRPPLVLAVNEVGSYYLEELRMKGEQKSYKTQLNKYVGSLLSSAILGYPHFMIPIHGPDICAQQWDERNVTTYVDFQKLRDEFSFWKTTGNLRPLPQRTLLHGDMELREILNYLERFSRSRYVSTDIETVYPKKGSSFYPHPGYAIVIGLADSKDFGVSFELFRSLPHENRILWRALEEALENTVLIGQNFFNFDSYFLKALGFSIKFERLLDTLIRHHILWPELPHTLQFMTRQYTRQPYYKDDGKHWALKHMNSLKRYNALDVTVTYEVFEGQEEDFKDRPHLKGDLP